MKSLPGAFSEILRYLPEASGMTSQEIIFEARSQECETAVLGNFLKSWFGLKNLSAAFSPLILDFLALMFCFQNSVKWFPL